MTDTAAAASPTERLDDLVHASLARSTRALSVVSPGLALADWALHLALSPGRCMELGTLALQMARASTSPRAAR